ncbi:MAG TPA: hypothetical protein PLK76_00935 [bacterium]|nr:hypothetical protein [bacterium]
MSIKIDKVIRGALVAGSLFIGAEGVEAKPPTANPKNREKKTEMRNEVEISAEDAFERAKKYLAKKEKENPGRGVEIFNDPKAIENILARVMMSEEKRHPNQWHLAILIAWTVINRVRNGGMALTSEAVMKVVTHDKDFGLQSKGRPYDTSYEIFTEDPNIQKKTAGYYRIFSRMILDGEFNDYNKGQVSFFHIQAQRAAHAKDPSLYPSPEQVIKNREGEGLEIVLEIPGYVVFFKKK